MAKTDKRSIWMRRIAACERSGMTQRSWCAAHGINANTYGYWQRQLRGARAKPRRQMLVPA